MLAGHQDQGQQGGGDQQQQYAIASGRFRIRKPAIHRFQQLGAQLVQIIPGRVVRDMMVGVGHGPSGCAEISVCDGCCDFHDMSGEYTGDRRELSIVHSRRQNRLQFRDLRSGDLHVGPAVVNPVFKTFQGAAGNGPVRAHRHEPQHGDGTGILPVHLGAGHIEAVATTSQDALDDTAFLLQGVSGKGQVQFEAVDEHGWFRLRGMHPFHTPEEGAVKPLFPLLLKRGDAVGYYAAENRIKSTEGIHSCCAIFSCFSSC
ncbi:protein of unknown function [Trichlorobacter ammonificans]|uniref:Uncharacterized protein n=1 Tax=Trichlorobacter ammonificans TaxID=2916410 RepID=A0ABM9D9J4_9BACT|nr:protein of unknown function [Trichlorobacter ammonificans]